MKNRYNADETGVLACSGLRNPNDIPEKEAVWDE
jgi:hypothetical protein